MNWCAGFPEKRKLSSWKRTTKRVSTVYKFLIGSGFLVLVDEMDNIT